MKKYFEVAKVLFKSQLAYRFETAFNMLFTISKILFAYILWGAVFGEREEVSAFTFNSMLSYYIVSSVISRLEMSDGVSGEISSRIRNGTFSKYMVTPVNMQNYFMAQTAGASAFYISFNLIAAVVWVFIFQIRFAMTTDILLIVSAIIICLLGLFFMVQLNYFLGILTFRFNDIKSFLMIKNCIVSFVTGTLVPLVLLPQGIAHIMRYFPFYYVTYLPSMLLIGRNGNEALTGIITLSLWVLAFVPINLATYNRLRVKYDGVGI